MTADDAATGATQPTEAQRADAPAVEAVSGATRSDGATDMGAGVQMPVSEMHRLIDELLPALVSRIESSELGEIDVRDGAWRIRLRRSPGVAPAAVADVDGGRRGERGARSSRGAATPGRDRGDAGRPQRAPSASGSASSGNGAHPSLMAVGPGRGSTEPATGEGSATRAEGVIREGRHRPVTSPAVGYFVAREGVAAGHQVRSGDVLGHVDVLGVRQEVVAPSDGIVARVLAQPGEAVEYGQELLRLASETSPRPERVG